MITLNDLQNEVRVWADRNFPDAKPHQPLLGVSEECGELCHAHLKMEQGIRGTYAEHVLAKNDAIGDIIIYLADYCGRNGIDLQAAVEIAWNEVKKRDWQNNPKTGQA